MKIRFFAIIGFFAWVLSSCSSNNVSNIPHIVLVLFEPDSMKVNIDTCLIEFSLTDGDGDIGNTPTSVIWLKDSRCDTFGQTPFPQIDQTIEDPKKGLTGTCLFMPIPQPVPRTDSAHLLSDTLTYELYITDRANHASNHIVTHPLIVWN